MVVENKSKKVSINVQLSAELRHQFKLVAMANNKTMRDVLIAAIYQYLAETEAHTENKESCNEAQHRTQRDQKTKTQCL